MFEVQRSEPQVSLKDQLKQRRRDLNFTAESALGDSLLNETAILEQSLAKSKSLEGSKLMSSMIQRREQRKQTLDQSMGKNMKSQLDIPSIPTINIEEDELDKSQLKPSNLSASVNLSASIRDRLKDRAKMSMDTAMQNEPERKLRGLRNRELQTRFDIASETNITGDENGIKEDKSAIDSVSSDVAKSWKILAKRNRIEKDPEPLEDVDEYSFFTKEYETPSSQKQLGNKNFSVPEVDEANFAQYDSLYVLSKPILANHDTSGKLFVPSSLPPETVTLHGGTPCFLDDEGIYVGEPPGIIESTWNRMEQRLVQTEEGKKWFGIDGTMIVAPDPLKQISSRPMIDFEVDHTIQRNSKCISTAHAGKMIGERTVNQLFVTIAQLQFSHHPLFSKEHVLVSQMRDLYIQYLDRQRHGLAAHLEDRLQSLRDAVKELKSTLGSKPWDMSKPFNKDCVVNLEDYQEEIRNVREMCDLESLKDKQMLKSILTFWKDIKELRETQGFVSTNAKVLVYKEDADFSQEDKDWQRLMRCTFEEKKEEVMSDYEEVHRVYQSEFNEWKVKARERKKNKSKKKEEASEVVPEDESSDNNIVPPKPVAPEKPKLNSLLNEIQSNASRCRKIPGDPILKIEMTHTVAVTAIEDCPLPEQKRRKELQRSVYLGKLFYNNSEVMKTASSNPTSDFVLNFSESICLQVVRWPESIKFELWGTSEKICEMFMEIPPSDRHSGNTHLEAFEFSSNQKVTVQNSTAVGSGVPEAADGKILLTSGKLMGSTAWMKDSNGKILAPARQDIVASFGRADPIQAIGARSLNDMEKVIQWISDAKLDPNDPRNAPLLHLMNKTRKDAPSDTKYFRLDHLEKHTYFASTEEIEHDKRFKILSLRNQGVPEYKPMKMVPMFTSEVTHFELVHTEKEEKVSLKEEGDVFENHRMAVSRFMQGIQEKIASRSQSVRPMLDLCDVVVEEQVPDISTLGRSIAKLLEPRHPLRPQRKERKKVTTQAVGVTKVDLLINVSQAQCLPIRRKTSSDTRVGLDPSIRSTVQLRPFVEVTFQRRSRVTHVADGPNPCWNQELDLPLNVVNNEFSATNLRKISDIVYFNVFDEIIIDILEDDRLRTTNIHQRLERRWLGSFQIPFSTIYLNSRIEGKFKLNVPSTLMGYNKDHGQMPHLLHDPTSVMSIGAPADKDSYLTIFITVEPPLAPQPPLREIFDSNEDVGLIRATAAWEMLFKENFPSRSVTNLVTDVNGKSVFITRFITPQNPPAVLVPEDHTSRATLPVMKKVAKFVSLIPYYEDSISFAANCDIWVASEMFLKMLGGDEEEHAILLCNYFLYLGIDAYVVIGVGIPEGNTCYVLTKQADSVILWNPSTGNYNYQSQHNHSLVTVSAVFNHDNVWANIQLYDDPGRLNFNLKNSSYWKPFFAKTLPKLSTIQTSRLDYIETNLVAIATLESNLEKMLMDKIMEWRDRHVTRWNRHCRVVMRELLPKLESGELTDEDQLNAMAEILNSHNVVGFPLNMRYSDASSIIESVYSTNVHVSEDAAVELALTVYIHPYPNNVLSVWIYVGTLIKKF